MLPQKQRQVICRVWLPSFAALLMLSLGCRLTVVVARRCLLDGGAARLRHREPLLDVSEAQAPVTRGRFERRRKKRE